MIETIEIDREIAEVDGIIINCRNATIYAKVAIYSEGETMDQQIIALLTDIKTVLQQTKERDDAWLDEVRQRDKAMDKHSRQIEARYVQWRKEDMARIKRNEEIAQRNYDMAAKLYAQQLEKAYWIGLNAERPEEEMPAEAIKEMLQPANREEMLKLVQDEIDKVS